MILSLLGALPLVEGGGAKHSPPGAQGISTWWSMLRNMMKIMISWWIPKIISDHPRASRITMSHPYWHLDITWMILSRFHDHLFFMISHDLARTCHYCKGSHHRTGMALISSERALKTMVINIENESDHELHPKLWRVKVGPGPQTGGTPLRQFGSRLLPEGECFAPFYHHQKSSWTWGTPSGRGRGCEALSSRCPR